MIDNVFTKCSAKLVAIFTTANMISSHGGNLSIRLGDRVVIKRRGAMLGKPQGA